MKKLINIIKHSKNIAIFVHSSPDGDALGSASAFLFAMKKLGKSGKIFCADELKFPFNNMEEFSHIEIGAEFSPKCFDLCVLIDFNDCDRCGVYSYLIKDFKNVIAIDHHPDKGESLAAKHIDTLSAAAGEALFDVLTKMHIKFDDIIAKYLYIAIMMDTASLMTGAATSHTLEIMSKLLKFDINSKELIQKLFKNRPKEMFDIENYIYNNMKIVDDMAYIFIDNVQYLKNHLNKYDLSQFVHVLTNIQGVKLACMVKEYLPNCLKGSLRSDGTYNCTKIANRLGGGGHFCASGFKIDNKKFDEAKEEILNAIKTTC